VLECGNDSAMAVLTKTMGISRRANGELGGWRDKPGIFKTAVPKCQHAGTPSAKLPAFALTANKLVSPRERRLSAVVLAMKLAGAAA
jgi:hypothetical protein